MARKWNTEPYVKRFGKEPRGHTHCRVEVAADDGAAMRAMCVGLPWPQIKKRAEEIASEMKKRDVTITVMPDVPQ